MQGAFLVCCHTSDLSHICQQSNDWHAQMACSARQIRVSLVHMLCRLLCPLLISCPINTCKGNLRSTSDVQACVTDLLMSKAVWAPMASFGLIILLDILLSILWRECVTLPCRCTLIPASLLENVAMPSQNGTICTGCVQIHGAPGNRGHCCHPGGLSCRRQGPDNCARYVSTLHWAHVGQSCPVSS